MIRILPPLLLAPVFAFGQLSHPPIEGCTSPLTPGGQAQDAPDQNSEVDPALREAAAEIQVQVEEIRGLKFKHPVDLRVTSEAELKAYLVKTFEEETTAKERASLDAVVKMTGLLPADQDLLGTQMELLESQVGGFYDPKTKTFSLMQSLVGSGLAKVILAHELTHALDDQHFDLAHGIEAREDNSDALWAYQAVLEGSATAVMNKWTLKMMTGGGDGLSAKDLEQAGEMGADVLERMQPFLWKTMLGAYLRGSSFLARTENVMTAAMTMPSGQDLDRAFQAPPQSSEQVLHPSRYWDDVDQPMSVTFDLGNLPSGIEALDQDTFGELQLGCIVEPPDTRKGLKGQMAVMMAKYTSPAVTGWGGDRWVLLGRGKQRLLVLRTRWDSVQEAQEFDQTLAQEDLVNHFRSSLAKLAKAWDLTGETAFQHRSEGSNVTASWSVGFSTGTTEEVLKAL